MLAFILILVFGIILASMVNSMATGRDRSRLMGIIVVGFLVRPLLFLTVMRSFSFFSHGRLGGDSIHYQMLGSEIAYRWVLGSVHFVTEGEMPALGSVALPCNVLALLEYMGGEPQPLAGTLINAFLACWMVLILIRYLLDREVEFAVALAYGVVVLFSPAFVFHTSDTYKDGVNAFLVLVSLVLAMRLSSRVEPTRVLQLLLCLGCLWFVRRYMVFMCLIPLGIGILGPGSPSVARRWLAGGFVATAVVATLASGAADSMVARAETTFDYATSDASLSYNADEARAGSGVTTTNPLLRLAYTVLAPFPWQGGSVGFQLGKIEAFVAYAFLYLVWRHRNHLWRTRRSEVLMIAVLVVPGLIAYSMTMSNVGLVVRQRLPLVFAIGLMASLGYQSSALAPAPLAPVDRPVARPRHRRHRPRGASLA